MRFHQFLAVSCLSFFSLVGNAEILTDLYRVRETVSSQTPEERTQATQNALETLFLRLTGDSKTLQSPSLRAIRKDPQQIISQYGYDGGPPEILQVDFDPISTDYALRQAGFSLWGANRPALLVWWLNDSVDSSNLVGDDQAAAELLRHAAQHRGLPLHLPLADLTEQLIGTAENLESGNSKLLRDVSERYGADALLAVHARKDDGKWTAKWRLLLAGQQEQGSAEAYDQATLSDTLLLLVSQRLALRYTKKPVASNEQLLEVQGMTLEHYAQSGRLLEPFSGQLKSVDGGRIFYRVNGSDEQLRLRLGQAQLHEVKADQGPAVKTPGQRSGVVAAPTPHLRFRW